MNYSKVSLLVCFLVVIAGLFINPRWTKSQVHATISYDVSGYYIYLPAIFIYKDLKKVSFKEKIHQKYKNSSHTYQTSTYSNGNEVTQYSCGLAVQYLPFFIIADMLAEPLGYERDGYSLPYQAGIHWGSVLVAFIGLFYLRKNLLEYFSDKVTAITLFLLVLATNYWNYAAIDTAMVHNYLFTLFSLLIWNTIQWYKKPTYARAVGIGFVVGLAALTRPTEIVMAIIPISWGLNVLSKHTRKANIQERFSFLGTHYPKLLLSVTICLAVGSIQLIYWKYVGGEWFIYSYGEEIGFDWLRPHIKDGMFSFRKGWLIYTPIMVFSLLGIALMLWKKHMLSWLILVYLLVIMYITFSWSIWWYGGSVGQRPMVQAYAILAFPFAYSIQWMLESKKRFIPFLAISVFCCYFNIWLHYQAHIGGQFDAENTTREYFLKTFLKWESDRDDLKFLDAKEEFLGIEKNLERIYFNDFEKDTIVENCGLAPIKGKMSYCVSSAKAGLNGSLKVPILDKRKKWLRAGGVFMQKDKAWTSWAMPQFIVRFKKGETVQKYGWIKIPRLLHDNETRELFFEMEFPEAEVDEVEIVFWSESAEYPILADDLYMEVFD